MARGRGTVACVESFADFANTLIQATPVRSAGLLSAELAPDDEVKRMPAATGPKPPLSRRRAYAGCVMTSAELDALIEEATVDAYNDHEQITGLFTMLDEHLTVPFDTELLGAKVTVRKIDLTVEHEIVAICRRNALTQAIPILDLPLPAPRPDGAEWIDAYRRWRR
jgi:hypothetical protein